jgi:hypothetical protein
MMMMNISCWAGHIYVVRSVSSFCLCVMCQLIFKYWTSCWAIMICVPQSTTLPHRTHNMQTTPDSCVLQVSLETSRCDHVSIYRHIYVLCWQWNFGHDREAWKALIERRRLQCPSDTRFWGPLTLTTPHNYTNIIPTIIKLLLPSLFPFAHR